MNPSLDLGASSAAACFASDLQNFQRISHLSTDREDQAHLQLTRGHDRSRRHIHLVLLKNSVYVQLKFVDAVDPSDLSQNCSHIGSKDSPAQIPAQASRATVKRVQESCQGKQHSLLDAAGLCRILRRERY